MSGFWTKLATLNAPFLAATLRKLADEIEQLFPGSPKWTTEVIFIKGGVYSMGAITVKDSDAPFGATVTFLDAKGAATNPDDVPQWSVDDPNVATVVASDDGLSATVTPGLPGAAIVTVSSTDTDGSVVSSQGTVTVQPGEAVIGDVEFSQ